MKQSNLSTSSQQKNFYSTSDKPRIKQYFFGYTAPLPGDASPKKRKEASKFLKEIAYITQTTSRFTLQDPQQYLKTTTPGILAAHLTREIEIQKQKIAAVKNSDEYMKYMELHIKREMLANELLRLQHLNSTLVNESNKAAQRLAKVVSETVQPKLTLDFREATNYKEECERLIELYQTQMAALNDRKKRQLIWEINEERAAHLLTEIEQLTAKTELLKEKQANKKEKDAIFLKQLQQAKSYVLDKLIQYYNENDEDIEVPMGEVIEYVKKEDPVIQLRQFQKCKNSLVEKEEIDLENAFEEDVPDKPILK